MLLLDCCMKYIHEECLKEWIISKKIDKKNAACELCKKYFSTVLKSKLKFNTKSAGNKDFKSWIYLICLIGVIIGLISTIVYFMWYSTLAFSNKLTDLSIGIQLNN